VSDTGWRDMKVKLKLFASLGQYLPAHADRNEATIDVPDGTTIGELLDLHGVPREACHLLLLNGLFQPPACRAEVKLKQGDTVAVWPPVAGG
jgi:molybdopterin converting factor small subunit